MDKLRVVEINETFNLGSTGTIVRDLQNLCEHHGIDCYVAYARADQKNVRKGYQIGGWLSHKFHALLCRVNGRQAYFSTLATIRFCQYLKQLKPDVVHFHNLHGNYLNLNRLLVFLSKSDIKTVVTLHDCWFYTGGCFHYTLDKCYKWEQMCGRCPKKRTDTPSYFLDKSSDILADRIHYFGLIPRLYVTGVSGWILKEGKKKVFKGRPSSIVYNGVDLSVFHPSPSQIASDIGLNGKKILMGLAVKWLDPINKKTLDYFVNNLKPDQQLLLFGATSEMENMPSNVTLYGFTRNREELAKLYSAASVFVNCTREESLSLINIEAQACGTPVVTYDGTGVQETVDNKCGYAVKSGDYVALFNKVQSVIDSPPSSSSIISWIDSHFEKDKNYAEYIRIYKEFEQR